MSGRIGALNTAGRGCVFPLALPSLPAMLTVGRTDIMDRQAVNWALWLCLLSMIAGIVRVGRRIVWARLNLHASVVWG